MCRSRQLGEKANGCEKTAAELRQLTDTMGITVQGIAAGMQNTG